MLIGWFNVRPSVHTFFVCSCSTRALVRLPVGPLSLRWFFRHTYVCMWKCIQFIVWQERSFSFNWTLRSIWTNRLFDHILSLLPSTPQQISFFRCCWDFYFNGNFLQDSVKFLDFCFDSLYWGSSLPLACFFVIFLFLIVGCLLVDVLFSFHLNFILFFRLLFALHSCVIMSFTSVRFFLTVCKLCIKYFPFFIFLFTYSNKKGLLLSFAALKPAMRLGDQKCRKSV